jgi:Tetratricopeptide repeat/WD40-like Beta Propeller Repeat
MRNSLFTYIFSIIFLVTFQVQAQSWRSLSKDAKKAYEAGKYLEAGDAFTKAWEKKEKNTDLIYRAGECYMLVKEYRKAAESYQHIKDENKKYNLAGLRYARALKQDGQYKAAIQEFVYFLSIYQAEDKTLLSKIVNNEVQGCELALQQNEAAAKETPISRLGSDINTSATEFAPVPFADDILYFSSTRIGTSRIYRTQQQNGDWRRAVKSENFPEVEGVHIANGSFSPDGSRFYFTECKPVQSESPEFSTHCEIFVMMRKANGWSQPERLRDYINEATSTNTQPNIVHEKGKEIMYFASNRKGGQGGMDIWYAVRDIHSNDVDFAVPVNVGTIINTAGDEISPSYDLATQHLYFSSNGLVTLGGHDVFKIAGSQKQWDTPINLGAPLNSPADDYYFVLNKTGNGGFFSSNRKFEKEKTHTHDEDIYAFTFSAGKEAIVSGAITDGDKNKINEVSVSLFDITEATQKRLLQIKTVKDGTFDFKLLPEKKLRLEAQKEAYVTAVAEFTTPTKEKLDNMNQPLILVALPILTNADKKVNTIPNTTAASTNTPPTKPAEVKPTSTTTVITNAAPTKNNTTPPTSLPKPTEVIPITAGTNTAPIKSSTTALPKVEEVKTTPTTTVSTATPPLPKSIEVKNTTVSTNTSPTKTVEVKTTSTPASTQPVLVPVKNTEIGTKPVIVATPIPTSYGSHVGTTDHASANNGNVIAENIAKPTNGLTPRIMKGTRFEPNDVITTAKILQGVYFKVQILAIEDFDEKQIRYQNIESLGRLETEFIIGKNLVRVLIANVRTINEAERVQNAAIRNGFPEAFVVRYENGERIGRWK